MCCHCNEHFRPWHRASDEYVTPYRWITDKLHTVERREVDVGHRR
jgi:hypothetical protein